MLHSNAAKTKSAPAETETRTGIISRWVAIAGRRTFVISMAAGFLAGATMASLTTNEMRAAAVAVGAFCIMAGTARRAFVAESAAEALRNKLQDEASYHAFVDSAAEGFFRTTRDGRYLICNPALAQIYGYPSPERLTSELTDIASTLYVDPQRRTEFVRLTEKDGVLRDFVSQIRRRDGSTIWILENARKVTDEDNQFLFYEGTVQDITEKIESERAIRQALQETREAVRAKAAFLAAMSHELKTPLNAVIGFSDLMLQETFGPVEPSRYREYVGDIYTNGHRLLCMINDILDISRIEGGLMTLEEANVALTREIQAVWEDEASKNAGRVDVSFDFPENLAPLKADPKRLRQVLGHIFSNAMKFTPRNGLVRVRARHTPEGGAAITVQDNGIGMAPELIRHALEPFRQLDGRLQRNFEGAGLGLPLANALVKLHGGRLMIDSTPGAGTKVVIEFPPERMERLAAA